MHDILFISKINILTLSSHLNMTKETIPVIDISSISLDKGNLKSEQFSEVSYHLAQALSTWGFAYLKNHGIPAQQVRFEILNPSNTR